MSNYCIMLLYLCVFTSIRDSADRVVGEQGTYEELIACSHEIAASTAQLVAASKVQNVLLLVCETLCCLTSTFSSITET